MTKLTNPETQLERIYDFLAETVAEMSNEEILAEWLAGAAEDGMDADADKVKEMMQKVIADLKGKR